jgi:hypothetical protein
MEYHNALEPNEEQITGFLAPSDGRPIYMLNLLKYKDKAEYADGRDTELSGRDAYLVYGVAVIERLAAVKGRCGDRNVPQPRRHAGNDLQPRIPRHCRAPGGRAGRTVEY